MVKLGDKDAIITIRVFKRNMTQSRVSPLRSIGVQKEVHQHSGLRGN